MEKTVQALCTHFQQDAQNQLRLDKRHSWSSINHKALFYDVVRDLHYKTSFLDYLHMDEQVVQEQGLPWRPNPEGRGRAVMYDPNKLTAILLLKDLFSGGFRGLVCQVKEVGYDARLASHESYPEKR